MLAMFRVVPQYFATAVGRLHSSPALIRAGGWLAAALIVGWVLASWFWQIAAPDAAPRIEAAPPPDHQAAAKAVVSRHLFGRASSAGDEAGEARGGVSLRLLGAVTASPKAAGFAILAEEGKPSVAALEGETFMPGVTLLEVLPGRVRVKIGEQVETIEMANIENTSRMTQGEVPAVVQVPAVEPDASLRPGRRPRVENGRP